MLDPSRTRALAIVGGMMLVSLFAAAHGGSGPAAARATNSDPSPFPSGSHAEWPPDAHGPYAFRPIEHLMFTASDGVVLDGYLRRPDLPDGLRAPIIFWPSAYFAAIGPDENEVPSAAGPPYDAWESAGYAIVTMSARGSGNSGGCLELFGPRETLDQAELVDWLGNMSWSNGRVGMIGDSYDGTLDLEAAIQAPRALKTIVPVAPVPEAFGLISTPQGAIWPVSNTEILGAFSAIPLAPRIVGDPAGQPDGARAKAVDALARGGARMCPDVQQAFADLDTDDINTARDAAFWQARDMRPRLADVRAAVLYTDGFYDDQYFEGEHVWDEISHAPKEYVAGPWEHMDPTLPDWRATEDAWLDFWLKGLGETPSGLGHAVWEEADTLGPEPGSGTGAMHASAAWPPPEAQQVTYALAGSALAVDGVSSQRNYHSAPLPDGMDQPVLGPGGWNWPKAYVCDEVVGAAPATRLTYRTAPLAADTLIAGIPALDLQITSDTPGGTVSAYLFDLPGGFCETGSGESAVFLSIGAADLRYRSGGFDAEEVPVGSPFAFHLDLTDLGQRVPAGHEIALVIEYGHPADRIGHRLPEITVLPGADDAPTRLSLPILG